MDIFNTKTPAYRAGSVSKVVTHAQPAAFRGLKGLLGSVFGNATPTYKTADGRGARAPASSGIFGSLLSVATPSYKTVPATALAPSDTADPTWALADAELAGPEVDDGCTGAPVSEVVVLL